MARAMAGGDAVPSRAFWRDDEIICDRDGVPQFTGVQPHLMKECREGDGKDEDEEAADLKKKQQRLIDGLHGDAWRAVQNLVMHSTELKKVDGYKEVFAALQSVERES